MNSGLVRLQKFIADCGVASRRQAEKLIYEGSVTVNGKVIQEMGFKVIPGKDAVKVNNKLLLAKSRNLYVLFNKPPGVVTTLNDPEGRPTVKDFISRIRHRVFPVGRLDYDSEGLLLLTNDGEWAQHITHPAEEIKKVYFVKVKGRPSPIQMDKLRKGVTTVEGKVKVIHIEKIKSADTNDWFKMVISEGKNRMIRKMWEKVGFDVLKIKRVAIGRLTLGNLPKGQYRLLDFDEAEKALRN